VKFKLKKEVNGVLGCFVTLAWLILALLLVVLILLLPSTILYFGWNLVLVPVFAIKEILFWQAVLLWLFLSVINSILFRRK
jgi:hypothetical protein